MSDDTYPARYSRRLQLLKDQFRLHRELAEVTLLLVELDDTGVTA